MLKNSSYDFLIDLSIKCIFVKHYGVADLDSISARSKEISEHEDCCPDLNRVVDYSGCEIKLDSQDMRQISVMISNNLKERGQYREASIVDTLLAHGMVRILDGFISTPSVEYQIFKSEEQSAVSDLRDWLGIPEDYSFPGFMSVGKLS